MNKRALLLSAWLVLGTAASLHAQAANTSANLLGKWEFTVESPQGANVLTISFDRIEGALVGYGESQMGAFNIGGVTLTGSDLGFVLKFEQNGQTLDIPFKGKVTGDAAEGSLTFAMGDAPTSMPWKAKKLPG